MRRGGVRDGQLGSAAKKLTDAARYWAGGGAAGEDTRVTDVMRFARISEEEARAYIASQDATGDADLPEEFEVYPENWDTVMLFLRLQTQWILGGMDGRPVGLNYVAVESVMRMCRVKNREQELDRIRFMEAAALAVVDGEADDDSR